MKKSELREMIREELVLSEADSGAKSVAASIAKEAKRLQELVESGKPLKKQIANIRSAIDSLERRVGRRESKELQTESSLKYSEVSKLIETLRGLDDASWEEVFGELFQALTTSRAKQVLKFATAAHKEYA